MHLIHLKNRLIRVICSCSFIKSSTLLKLYVNTHILMFVQNDFLSMSQMLSIHLSLNWLQSIALTIPECFHLYCVEFKFRSHSAGSCFIRKVILSFGSSITSNHNNGIQWFLLIKICGIERSPSLSVKMSNTALLTRISFLYITHRPDLQCTMSSIQNENEMKTRWEMLPKKSVIEPLGQKESFM